MRNTVGADLEQALQSLRSVVGPAAQPVGPAAPDGVAEQAHRLLAVELASLVRTARRGDVAVPMRVGEGVTVGNRLPAAVHNSALALHAALVHQAADVRTLTAPSDLTAQWSQLDPRDHPVHALAAAASRVLCAAEGAAGLQEDDGARHDAYRATADSAAAHRSLLCDVATVSEAYGRGTVALAANGHLPPGHLDLGVAVLLSAGHARAMTAGGAQDHSWRDVHSRAPLVPAPLSRASQLPAGLQRLTVLLDATRTGVTDLGLAASALSASASAAQQQLASAAKDQQPASQQLAQARVAFDRAAAASTRYRGGPTRPGPVSVQAQEIATVAFRTPASSGSSDPALAAAVARQLPAASLALRSAAQRLLDEGALVVSGRDADERRLPGRLHLAAWQQAVDLGQWGVAQDSARLAVSSAATALSGADSAPALTSARSAPRLLSTVSVSRHQ